MEEHDLQSSIAPGGDVDVLRVTLLGGFSVALGSCAVPDSVWRLRKAKALIKLLALAPGHRLHREQLIDMLWPDSDPEAGFINLRYALHVARRALGPATVSRYLVVRGEQVLLSSESQVLVDVDAFEAAAASARGDREPAPYRRATRLYTGDLLPEDRYEDWAERRREELRRTYLTLVLDLARLYEERGELGQAIEALRLVVTSEPAHEEAHAGLMRLYSLTGHRDRALRQYDELRRALREELDAEPELVTTQLYENLLAGEPAVSRSHRPAAAHSTDAAFSSSLPATLTNFIGRERESQEVERLLQTTRLLTLTGVGGTGKTRLALEVARSIEGEYPDGVWIVELAALSNPSLVAEVVARAVGVPEQPGQPLIDTLVSALRTRRTLLVLDNCEHLLDACALLSESLLRGCARLRILTTSREPLGTPAETVWSVPALSWPPDPSGALERLREYEAVRLFVDRASHRRPDFALTPENAAAVAKICAQLEGIPLALELAAARVGSLPVEQIAARLHHSLNLLAGTGRTMPARQRTMRAALDWSYGLLSESERTLFRRLSVYAGGWKIEAAEGVCASDGQDGSDVLNVLSALVDKSMVVAEVGAEGRLRYRLLEPVRQYARERIDQSGEAETTHRQHAAYYLALSQEAGPKLWGPDKPVWLARLEEEHDNLRGALAWSLGHGERELALRLAAAMWWFWSLRGHLSEGSRWLEAALTDRDGVPPAVVAKALDGAASLTSDGGELDRALLMQRESLAIRRELGDKRDIADSLVGLGIVMGDMGEVVESAALFEASAALFREANCNEGLGFSLGCMGWQTLKLGDYEQAKLHFQESLDLSNELRDDSTIAGALRGLGSVAEAEGKYELAASLIRDSLSRYWRLGEKLRISQCLDSLAHIAGALGRWEATALLLGATVRLRDDIGAPMEPARRARYQSTESATRAHLDDTAFMAVREKGRGMPLEEAVKYALSPHDAHQMPDTPSPEASARKPSGNLTPREREIALLIARGLKNREVATRLLLASRTVDHHVANILRKLELRSRSDVAVWVTEQRLFPVDG